MMRVSPSEMSAVLRVYNRLSTGELQRDERTSVSDGLETNARSDPNTAQPMVDTDQVLTETCNEYVEVFEKSFAFPYLVVVTTPEAVVLERFGDVRSVQRAELDGIVLGHSLALNSKGINPFSTAMVLKRPLFIEKYDKWIHSLQYWNSFVFPFNGPKNDCAGLVGFLFSEMPFGPGVGPFLQAIVMKMELTFAEKAKKSARKWQTYESMEESLLRFGLTERERQIATYWALDYDYKQISKAIGISEHTVRSIIYRINNKLNVNSKASMILRLFDAI